MKKCATLLNPKTKEAKNSNGKLLKMAARVHRERDLLVKTAGAKGFLGIFQQFDGKTSKQFQISLFACKYFRSVNCRLCIAWPPVVVSVVLRLPKIAD